MMSRYKNTNIALVKVNGHHYLIPRYQDVAIDGVKYKAKEGK